jgi:type IV pilus assembly protein PilC
MPNFTYKALDAERKIVEGITTAGSREEVAQILAKKSLSPLVVRPVADGASVHGTIPQVDKITFCRYLGVMLKSGLALSEGIEVLLSESKHPLMKRILSDMLYSLEQGQQLSTIFGRYPDVFEPYFLTLTRAGEVSGNLSDVFHFLEIELRSEYRLNAKVKGALMYPTIVLSAAAGMGLMLYFFILPQIGKVFLSMKMPLPAMTKFLFESSIAMSKQMVWLVSGAVVFVGIFAVLVNRGIVKRVLLRAVQPVPFVRKLIMKIDMARFNRIFSTLLHSAVPITDALEISLKSMTWYEYAALVTVLPDEIRKGKQLSEAVSSHKAFPSLMVQMIAAGEKTATLDETLGDLAGFYEEEVEEELKNLTQILEPVIMLLVGVIVGAMILSIIAPIYTVVGNFQTAAGGR